jgi:hypothetical protein
MIMMSGNILKRCLLLWTVATTLAVVSFGGNQKPTPEEILKTVAAKGVRLIEALRTYTYYAELTIQTVSDADVITGEFYRFTVISFDSAGNRQEKILENKSSLPPESHIGTNAANNLTRVYQFIITPETLSLYEFSYVGRERVDELDAYVFDVKPKGKMPNPEKSAERYLKGRVWIDSQDMCVVKASGEALPEQSSHRTPRFESYFQNHDDFWFPAYTSADDEVRMGQRNRRVRVTVRYTGYKKTGHKG